MPALGQPFRDQSQMTSPVKLTPGASKPAVRAAKTHETAAILDVLTAAFAGDPVVRWIFADESVYRDVFPRFAMSLAGQAFDLGTAYAEGSMAGAALWLPPQTQSDEDTMWAILEAAVPAGQLETIGAAFEELERYIPQEPFWYLALLGVNPARQGEGVGSALLAHTLRQCDEHRHPAFLEATCERNAALYRRHGFEDAGTVALPGERQFLAMVRQPK